MSDRILSMLAVTALVLLVGCSEPSAEAASADVAPTLDSDEQKASYAIGYRFVENAVLGQFGDILDREAFLAGVQDVLNEADARVSNEEAQIAMNALQEAQNARLAEQAVAGKAEGEAYLAENGKREGVVTTASGLQYEVLSEGEGDKPTAADFVTTHYEGRLINGEVFDSSYERGDPARFPLNGVIAGWTEGLQLMSPGAKYRFAIPSELAYGEQGRPGIPPNSTLVFDVELIMVEKADAPAS